MSRHCNQLESSDLCLSWFYFCLHCTTVCCAHSARINKTYPYLVCMFKEVLALIQIWGIFLKLPEMLLHCAHFVNVLLCDSWIVALMSVRCQITRSHWSCWEESPEASTPCQHKLKELSEVLKAIHPTLISHTWSHAAVHSISCAFHRLLVPPGFTTLCLNLQPQSWMWIGDIHIYTSAECGQGSGLTIFRNILTREVGLVMVMDSIRQVGWNFYIVQPTQVSTPGHVTVRVRCHMLTLNYEAYICFPSDFGPEILSIK